jgi:hypothetical protein
VYQRIHIGNARPFVLSMWLRRWLALRGYRVTLVENVTDVNDKIYDAARAQGIGSAELARRATAWYIEDTGALGLGRPDVEPLATETVPEIVALIGELISRGLAYVAGGDVYFRVARFPEYGRLSGAQPEAMLAQEPGGRRRTRGTSRSGKAPSRRRTPRGPRRGVGAARAGTSSAPRWPKSISGPAFTCTAAGSTCAFPIMRTSWPSPAAPGGSSPAAGCTTGWW